MAGRILGRRAYAISRDLRIGFGPAQSNSEHSTELAGTGVSSFADRGTVRATQFEMSGSIRKQPRRDCRKGGNEPITARKEFA